MSKFKVGDYARITMNKNVRNTYVRWDIVIEGETRKTNAQLKKLYPTYFKADGVIVRVLTDLGCNRDYIIEFPGGQAAHWRGCDLVKASPLEILAMQAEG